MTGNSRDPFDNPEFMARLRDFGVEQIEAGSVLAESSSSLVHGWCVALDRAGRPAERLAAATRAWLEEGLQSFASKPASDERRSLAAEVEAGLRLSWLGPVQRVPESKSPTPDFKVGHFNVEVYCPQEHTEERRVAEADLADQLKRAEGPVRVAAAISHPTIGSGRSVDRSGDIRRDPKNKALEYPANKLIDRLLHAKRDGRQFREHELNLLWLDLKHGLGLRAVDCVPFRSVVAKGTCFIVTHGVWHAFYGEIGSSHLKERTTLEWPVSFGGYEQQVGGWFREAAKVSAVILSVLDGVIIFESPWADFPLSTLARDELSRLSELRPDLSWLDCAGTLTNEVDAMLAKISWLAQLTGTRLDNPTEPPVQEAVTEADKP